MVDQEQAIFRLTIMSTCESPRLTKMSINEGPKRLDVSKRINP